MKIITKVFVVLLVISIIFVTYKSFYLEGFDDVPSCDGNTNSAPSCYATVRDDYSSFADVAKSDYILKTQIVTPVCPNSPYIEWDDDNYLDISSNTSEKDSNSNSTKDSNSDSYPQPDSKLFSQAAYKEDSPLLNNEPISDNTLSTPKLNAPAEPASSDDKKSQPSSLDTCPPCPACKRCPEPVVECKRVVNYKKAGSDNLPVPLIADFSKF